MSVIVAPTGVSNGNLQEGAGIETVPAKPQQESAENHQRRAVSSQNQGSAGVTEPPNPGSLNECTPKPGDAADHMDNAGAGKINNPRTEQQVSGIRGASPTVAGPEPVRNDGVDKASQERWVNQISHKLGPFGDGSAGDAGGGDGESPLVEEVAVVEGFGWNGLEGKEVFTDEAIGGRAKGKSEAKEVVEKATGGGIEDIGEHNIHGVLGTNRASAEHGEAKLHGKDEISREKEVSIVDRIVGVGEIVGDGGESIAYERGGGRAVGTQELSQLLRRAVQGRHGRWIPIPIERQR